MAPILLKKRDDNNTPHAASDSSASAKTSKAPVSRTTVSREKVVSDNNAKLKNAEEPAARRATSSASSTASRTSVKSATTSSKSKEPQKPETPETRTKTVKAATGGSKTTATVAVAEKPASPPVKAGLPLPSATLHKHKQAPVWASGKKKHKSNFGIAYDSGSIPCRINHGSIKNAVQWIKAPETLDFNPLLITCVEGFQETEHPFVFLARTMFRELVKLDDAREKALPVLPQVIPALRVALMASDDDVFLMGLEATRLLSDLVEEDMNTYLPKLTQQIHRKLLTKQLRGPVEDTLTTLERNGGKEALAIIRNKIPTYVSVH